MVSDEAAGTAEDSIGLLSLDQKASDHQTRPDSALQRLHRCVPCNLGLLLRLPKHFFIFLIPSFVTSRIWPIEQASTTLRSTAYLDGLRGLAASFVVHSHLSLIMSEAAQSGFGSPGSNNEIWNLPVARLSYHGAAAVSIFFVISGYALSISPVLAMRKRDPGSFMKKLASSCLRRPFRLYPPVFAAALFTFLLIRMGYTNYFITHQQEYYVYFKPWFGVDMYIRPKQPSTLSQFHEMLSQDFALFWVFVDDWRNPMHHAYDPPTWTIPVEFRASLVLYLTHATLYFIARKMRLFILGALVILGAWVESFDFPMFWLGYIMAEISPLLRSNADIKPSSKVQTLLQTVACTTMLLGGLYICSYPNIDAVNTPGYGWMFKIKPWDDSEGLAIGSRWWSGVGAPLIIYALDRLSFCRALLCLSPLQYLGKISFSFYLIHLYIVNGVALVFFHYAWTITGDSNAFTSALGFILGWIPMWVVIIWLSDIFQRCIDAPSTHLGFTLERWLFVE